MPTTGSTVGMGFLTEDLDLERAFFCPTGASSGCSKIFATGLLLFELDLLGFTDGALDGLAVDDDDDCALLNRTLGVVDRPLLLGFAFGCCSGLFSNRCGLPLNAGISSKPNLCG